MPGYDFVLSNATSYPDDTGDKQKVGFIYKTSTVSIVSTRVLLESAHPY
jgi:predicted extracellular nuclease